MNEYEQKKKHVMILASILFIIVVIFWGVFQSRRTAEPNEQSFFQDLTVRSSQVKNGFQAMFAAGSRLLEEKKQLAPTTTPSQGNQQ